MTRRVRLLVLDLDGVITDGTVQLLPSGDEVRAVHFRDLDAIAAARRLGIDVAILSGESGRSSRQVAKRFGIDVAAWGAKDKLAGLCELAQLHGLELDELCYVADADRDVPALEAAGLGLTPADASPRARAAADQVLEAGGGHGAVAEAVAVLERVHDHPGAGRTL
jgi:YrbI family 3-deoxy-D-manno-octulosonate 8-phosphate phosphatase